MSSDRELEKWYLEQQILKLEADNAALREALKNFDAEYWISAEFTHEEYIDDDDAELAKDQIRQVVSSLKKNVLASPQPAEPKEKP